MAFFQDIVLHVKHFFDILVLHIHKFLFIIVATCTCLYCNYYYAAVIVEKAVAAAFMVLGIADVSIG